MFAGKTALVTGASSGIGEATALALAEAGADVALNYLLYPDSAQGLTEKIEALGRKVQKYEVDVSDRLKVEGMVDHIVEDFGRIDMLVTCAVYSDREPFHTAGIEGFHKTIDVTMWGAFNALRAVTNKLIAQQAGGSIVVVGSPHAISPFPNAMAYNMAKAAVVQMAKTAAVELVEHDIRVNVAHPGWTDTKGERKFFSEDQLLEGGKSIPAGRLARSEEIARAILFLLSNESEYINGTELVIDGGFSLPWNKSRVSQKK
ncbi:MAG: SDR family oxidoreductase [Candidatus Obscuribacterales bacterium]|nr:SDR family oxidoreductase [Candidatus Obscuribacterales bacterium]